MDAPADINDALRFDGSFAGAQKAVELFKQRGVAVLLSVVLSAQNIDRIDNVVDLANQMDAAMVFQPYFDITASPDAPDPHRPESEKYKQAVSKLIRIKRTQPGRIASGTRYLQFIRDSYPTYDPTSCLAGELFFGLSPVGNLYPCYPMIDRGKGVELRPENVAAAVKNIQRAPCQTPCYCSGHIENNFLFRFDPRAMFDVMRQMVSLTKQSQR
jgi:MoaA/NifB/PqqE/SkfB family radical SAM enzyme